MTKPATCVRHRVGIVGAVLACLVTAAAVQAVPATAAASAGVASTGAAPAGCGPVTNDTNHPILPVAGTSPITVSGCARNASATAQVEVHIVLGYRLHAVIYLDAPDGSRYLLKAFGYDFGADIHETYTVNLSAEGADGTWRLLVRSLYSDFPADYIDSWTLTP